MDTMTTQGRTEAATKPSTGRRRAGARVFGDGGKHTSSSQETPYKCSYESRKASGGAASGAITRFLVSLFCAVRNTTRTHTISGRQKTPIQAYLRQGLAFISILSFQDESRQTSSLQLFKLIQTFQKRKMLIKRIPK